MCIGIPGQIVELHAGAPDRAWVDLGGVRHEINIALVRSTLHDRELLPGAWVLVYAGFALNLLDGKDARDILDTLQEMQEAGRT